jgi:cyclic dehypoxanthinyl futalosine synthase
MNLDIIYEKALQLSNISAAEALALYQHAPTAELMFVANRLRQLHVPGNGVSWQIDRNINITNVCISACKFCNFHCKLSETNKSFTTTINEYIAKIEELYSLGGNQVLLQGGLHPKYGLEFYSHLFGTLKQYFPTLKLHALGPPEIAHIARLEKFSYKNVLERLIIAGLDSLPGAGAEILSERVRKILSPAKPDVKAWLEVMREAHKLNLATSATMMFGHIETPGERIEHLLKIRDLQNERPEGTYGFLAFICWPVQSKDTELARQFDIKPVTATEYVRMVAISRIVLNNITNIQVSWLSVGKNVAELCLHGGANDMGSIMIEENVMSSAGAHNQFDACGIQAAISEAGFEPWLRNQKYEKIDWKSNP